MSKLIIAGPGQGLRKDTALRRIVATGFGKTALNKA